MPPLSSLFQKSYAERRNSPGLELAQVPSAPLWPFKRATVRWIPGSGLLEMRGCATHAACLILLLLSNDLSMN
jgi:hypothetical protein